MKKKRSRPAIDRAMERVERVTESGCWIYMGAVSTTGYGVIATENGTPGPKNIKVHRLVYEHFVGEIGDGLCVCHRCDVPSCCNPDHLFAGTVKENALDMAAKGRASKWLGKGEAHMNAKLTEEIVLALRAAKATRGALLRMVNELGVSYPAAWRAAVGQTWRHV